MPCANVRCTCLPIAVTTCARSMCGPTQRRSKRLKERVPCWKIAQSARLVTGVNLSLLLPAVSYRTETLDLLVQRAVVGGTQGVMQVAVRAPQNQVRSIHDQDPQDHQQ